MWKVTVRPSRCARGEDVEGDDALGRLGVGRVVVVDGPGRAPLGQCEARGGEGKEGEETG